MSLNSEKDTVKLAIKTILEDMLIREEKSTEEFANRLVEAIYTWLQNAQINYTSGLVAGSNAVTGTFNGTLE